MKTRNDCRKSAKWLVATLLVAGAAFARGSDSGAALSANGVVVGGKVCREAERVVAVYSNDVCVRSGPANRQVYVVNATGGAGVLVDFVAPGQVELFDVFGNRSGSVKVDAGITRLAIPPSGYAKVAW